MYLEYVEEASGRVTGGVDVEGSKLDGAGTLSWDGSEVADFFFVVGIYLEYICEAIAYLSWCWRCL